MIEDPIYDIVRKRKLQDSFKSIVNDVSSTKRKVMKKESIPYNTRHSSRLVHGSDFHERQRSAYCGLHSIHNLLRNTDITKKDLDESAKECAEESGDSLGNHKHISGFWSLNSMIRCLEKKGFHVKRAVKTKRKDNGDMEYIWNVGKTMYQLLDDKNVFGFIIHESQHYTCYRKTLDGNHWQYSNSYFASAQNMNPHEFCKQALEGVWNIFLVSKVEESI